MSIRSNWLMVLVDQFGLVLPYIAYLSVFLSIASLLLMITEKGVLQSTAMIVDLALSHFNSQIATLCILSMVFRCSHCDRVDWVYSFLTRSKTQLPIFKTA